MRKEEKISQRKYITEADVIRRHHKFIRQSDSSNSSKSKSEQRSARKNKNSYERYGEQMAKKYYSKLYKQYALVDLSRYETGQIGCRWRSQKQVLAQKSEKICGSVACIKNAINTFEINFGYIEEGTKKNALVKVSLCEQCQKMLNHKKNHKKLSPPKVNASKK